MKKCVLIKSPNGDSVTIPKIGFGLMLFMEWLDRQQEFIEIMVNEYDEENFQIHFRLPDFEILTELVAYVNANI